MRPNLLLMTNMVSIQPKRMLLIRIVISWSASTSTSDKPLFELIVIFLPVQTSHFQMFSCAHCHHDVVIHPRLLQHEGSFANFRCPYVRHVECPNMFENCSNEVFSCSLSFSVNSHVVAVFLFLSCSSVFRFPQQLSILLLYINSAMCFLCVDHV